MRKSPFFTIITASLNSGTTIQKTLESVQRQTFQNLEHIIIDGGSRDDTPHILQDYKNAYNLTWLSEPDSGISEALNKGLMKARGIYILVLQADDRLAEQTILEDVYDLIADERFDMWSFPVFMDDAEKGKILLRPIRVRWWIHFKTVLRHQGTFVHRRVYERIGKYRSEFSIAMDYDFFYRCLKSGCTLKFKRLPVAVMGNTGISSRRDALIKRLREERLVQQSNEHNPFWKCAQCLFCKLYVPYKTA